MPFYGNKIYVYATKRMRYDVLGNRISGVRVVSVTDAAFKLKVSKCATESNSIYN